MKEPIYGFQGEYRWLSNFWEFDNPMKAQGILYPTVEHFYVAMKTQQISEREYIARLPLFSNKSSGVVGVKKYGQNIVVRSDWDDIKVDAMEFALRYKFSDKNPRLLDKLVATGTRDIIEANRWNDTFWGVDEFTGFGQNILGNLIMKIRKEITDGNTV
ncbi:protein of unknown function DUF1768 [Vibrio phage 1.121.O._10N.286.46.C4]|nr:protein of unknown function DUF1768 [Vibrio phage 1.121.O._10N.286.46.C4]